MNKLASTKVAGVLSQVGPALRALSAENQDLREKVAHYEKKERVEKIASAMEFKNLDPGTSLQEKVARLMASEKLDVVEEAIELSAPQIKLAALSDEPGSGTDAASVFEAAILGS